MLQHGGTWTLYVNDSPGTPLLFADNYRHLQSTLNLIEKIIKINNNDESPNYEITGKYHKTNFERIKNASNVLCLPVM